MKADVPQFSLMACSHADRQLTMASISARVQAKGAVDIPSWLYQRLAEESAALAQAADAPSGSQEHSHRRPYQCELLALRGSAEVELAMASQPADPGACSEDDDL